MGQKNLAVISIIGRDQKGVVARISTYLASCDVNIEDIEQRVLEGLFIMTMMVDLIDVSISLDELVLGLKQIGEEVRMEISVRLHGERERKRVAVLVSKEAHCLEELLADQAAGQAAGDFVVVLSNHEILRPIAERAGIPFEWMASTDKAAHQTFLLERLREHRPIWSCWRATCKSSARTWWRSTATGSSTSTLLCCPYHPGANAYKQAFEEGVRVSGCTAHFVTEQLDQGPVILQDVFHIRVGEDTLDDVKERGKKLEAKVLSKAVQLFLSDQLVVKDKKVLFRPGHAPAAM